MDVIPAGDTGSSNLLQKRKLDKHRIPLFEVHH